MNKQTKYALASAAITIVLMGALSYALWSNLIPETISPYYVLIVLIFTAGLIIFLNTIVYRLMITNRLQNLESNIEAVAASENFVLTIPPGEHDEFQPIADNVNHILSRIADSQAGLRQKAKKYADMIEGSFDGIATLENGLITYANPNMCKLLGFSEHQLKGKPLLNYISPECKEIYIKNYGYKSSHRIKPEQNEIYIINSSLERIPVEITSKVVEMGVLMIVLRDIRESKKLQEEIAWQNDLIQRVLENISEAVAVLDADQKIIWLNATFRRVFTQTEKQAIGAPITSIIYHEAIVEALNCLSQSADLSLQKEFKLDQKGKTAIFTLDLTRMEKEYLLVIRDITEARTRQENLYLTNRLASVGEMASGIAHELNNPLTSIVGLSGLLMKNDLPEEIKQDIEDVHKESKRAAAIIKNMLTFARRHVSQKQVLQINDILEDVLKLRNYEHKCHNIQVNCNLSPTLPPINADYLQLQQVFLNIILNAESSMIEAHGRGTLNIEAHREDGHIKILFKDDGPGITKENMNHIFDPFFTTKEVGKGTGLGLSISYGIIKNHGGRIYAESEYGHGAAFIVELPVLN